MSATTTSATSGTIQDDTSYFVGVWGNNVLVGSGATEVFFAPGGSEVLTGNGTSDTYIVDSTSKHIEITDFIQARDNLAVYSSSGVSSLSALVAASHVTSAGLEIDFPDGAVVVLDGVTSIAALTATDTSFLEGAYTPPADAAPTTTLSALIGTATPSFVVASWGSHTLTATGTTNVFFAPGGNEVLTGAGSKNIYVIDSTTSRIEITNFNAAQDVLYLGSSSGVASLATLAPHAHLTVTGLELDLPNGATIVLDAVTSAASLTSSDTAFFEGAFTPPSTGSPTQPTGPTPPASTAATPPVVTATPKTLQAGQSVALSSLVTVTDPAGHAIVDYYVYDSSGSVHLNGAVNIATTEAQAKGYIEVAAADFGKLTFVAGSASAVTIAIGAYDGTATGGAKDVITVTGSTTTTTTTTTPTPPSETSPVVTATNTTLQSGQSVSLSSLVTVTDPSGHGIVDYFVYDSSGSVHLNGAVNIASAAAQSKGYFEVSAADFGKLTFNAGSAGTVTIAIGAYDGTGTGGIKDTITVTAGTASPTSGHHHFNLHPGAESDIPLIGTTLASG